MNSYEFLGTKSRFKYKSIPLDSYTVEFTSLIFHLRALILGPKDADKQLIIAFLAEQLDRLPVLEKKAHTFIISRRKHGGKPKCFPKHLQLILIEN